jgi:uncharacterized membrane protein YkvA (DUF1232 family)
MKITEPDQKKNFVESVYDWYRGIIRNPKYRWWIIVGTLLYLVSPIDILPDIIPVFGWIDDGIIASVLVAELSQLLLDRLKAGKSDVSDQNTTSTDAGSASNANTVDVNAVKVD